MRSFGHLPDLPETVAADLRHKHIGALLGASPAGTLPDSIDYSSLLTSVPDQNGSSACVGFAFATALYLRGAISGFPIPRPSAKWIYDCARMAENPRADLVDVGSRPTLAILGMQEQGIVAEDRWPLTPTNVNTPPPFDAFQHGFGALLSGYYRIESAPGAALLVKQALAKGFVPAFAMDVDSSYEQLASDAIYDGPAGPILGGHMQAITGYGPGYFIVAGSWGPYFSRGGFARISERFVDSGGAQDILVATLIPASVD